jgi:hypothetical protein
MNREQPAPLCVCRRAVGEEAVEPFNQAHTANGLGK